MEIFKLFGSIGIKNKEANKAIDETTGKARESSGRIKETFQKMATFLGTLFAGKAIFDFGKSVVEAAATAKAINAQFESVFGELEPQAREMVKGMASQMGILPERLNPMFSKLSSKYKGLGATTEEAMGLAARGTTLAADAAAFYDKSLEETSSSLNSFINGNYEGGEAIGLFANETQLAAWASANLGVNWKELDEKGKQIVRLQFAEAMQKAAGATGQASREADGYENVMGNLKQAWENFKTTVGGPILQPAVNGLMMLVEWLEKAQNFVSELYTKVQENGAIQSFKNAFENVKTTLEPLIGVVSDFVNGLLGLDSSKSSVETVADVVKELAGFLEDATGKLKGFVEWFGKGGVGVDVLKSAVVGLTSAWIGYKTVTALVTAAEIAKNAVLAIGDGLFYAIAVKAGLMSTANGLAAASATGAGSAFSFFNAVLMANPIMLVVTALAALVAGLVWFFTQTETGRAMWQSFMDWLSGAWSGFVEWGKETWQGLSDWFGQLWSGISSTVSSVWNDITSFLSGLWNGISSTASSVFDTVKNTITSVFEDISGTASRIWDGIKEKISGAIDGAKEAVDRAIGFIKGIMDFKWSLPKLSLPRITISGGFSLMPPSVPTFGIEWFAKGGIMTQPTLFGRNGNNAMVGGEAGPEAILPLNTSTLRPIGQAAAEAFGIDQSDNTELLYRIIEILQAILDKNADVYIDREKIGRITYEEHGRILGRSF